MIETALKFLRKFEEYGYSAYIVGGFVRDYLLEKQSKDIDITTNATPKQIKEIFSEACTINDDYGSVTVIYKKIRFEITTYRKEANYKDNRRPSEIIYTNDLVADLQRRDFTINSICMNKDRLILDPMHGIGDLHNKIIRTIGDPNERFSEDVLRILRAIRFATTLEFTLEDKTKEAILHNKHLLKKLSLQRKKEELDKIFATTNIFYGIELIRKLHLEKDLELTNLNKIKYPTQVIGIWTLLEVDDIYPFTRNERKLMKDIRKVMEIGPLNRKMLYQYGLYTCTVAGELMGINKKEITEQYQELPIHSRSDLLITTEEILIKLEVKAGPFLKEMYEKIEELVLEEKISNRKESILTACKEIYPVII